MIEKVIGHWVIEKVIGSLKKSLVIEKVIGHWVIEKVIGKW